MVFREEGPDLATSILPANTHCVAQVHGTEDASIHSENYKKTKKLQKEKIIFFSLYYIHELLRFTLRNSGKQFDSSDLFLMCHRYSRFRQ